MAKNDSAEAPGEADELLKKRARRRLVGAIALVLFAVIALPMVMDHEPRPTGPEIQVRIPSQEGTTSEGRVPPAKVTKAVVSTPVAEEKPLVQAPEKPEAALVAKAEPQPELKSEPRPEPKVEAKPAVAEKKKVEAVESGKAHQALAGGSEQWEVQLGAYQEAGRVKLLLGKLKELGVPAFTEKVDTPQGMRTRVRAGPFPTREAATRAQERVKIIGVSGPVAQK